jgi:integrase
MRYPADPPTVDEIGAVMRHTSVDRHGWRVRTMIVVLWRAGLRIQEALALAEHDLDHRRGWILIRNGKGAGECLQSRRGTSGKLTAAGSLSIVEPANVADRLALAIPRERHGRGRDPRQ